MGSLQGVSSEGVEKKLSRKADQARQARARHKQFVAELQEQAEMLHKRCRELEAEDRAAAVCEGLQQALSPSQCAALEQWLRASQGEDHMLRRYTLPPLPPMPTPVGASSQPATPAMGPADDAMDVDDEEDRGSSPTYDPLDILGAHSILNIKHSPLVMSAPARA
mmetsp:Transcript_45853/g.147710  ORF Transcript_45853/g.147710 Transcript_45853/m.147710 type:complete len:165 (-) Transcript_45853:459-953(-)